MCRLVSVQPDYVNNIFRFHTAHNTGVDLLLSSGLVTIDQ